MADDPISPAPSTEERLQRIEDKTSFGTYARKQVIDIAVMAGGALAGFGLAKGLLKNKSVEKFAEDKLGHIEAFGPNQHKTLFSGAGAAVGAFLSSIGLGYGHWKKLESEKLAVDEINRDTGNLVTERARFADTLNRQESLVQDLLAERDRQGTTHTERAASAAEATAASRS